MNFAEFGWQPIWPVILNTIQRLLFGGLRALPITVEMKAFLASFAMEAVSTESPQAKANVGGPYPLTYMQAES